MMSTSITFPTTTLPTSSNQTPRDGAICSTLDTLVQPHFFCGQLLTDLDLMALVRLVQDKARLSRYRHGWGVACGLDVRCIPQKPTQVMVSPGYAISCCGDDIVIAQDYVVNLAELCRQEPAPCDPRARGNAQNSETVSEQITLFGCTWPADEIRVVDLFLRYREEGAEFKTPLDRNACSPKNDCEHSRTREVFCVIPQLATLSSDPVSAAAANWNTAYQQSLAVLSSFRTWWNGQKSPSAKDIRQWFLDRIQKYPLHQFCSIWDCLCAMEDAEFSEERVASLVFWLALDYRNAFLSCDCASCLDGQGVPLARVWLRVGNSNSQHPCQVLAIDTAPPYRRLLHPACWPAPLGQVNIAPVIWRRRDEACAVLTTLGVGVNYTQNYPVPTSVNELEVLWRALSDNLFLDCGQDTVVQWVEVDGLGQRVIGCFNTGGDERVESETMPAVGQVVPPSQATPEQSAAASSSSTPVRAGARRRV